MDGQDAYGINALAAGQQSVSGEQAIERVEFRSRRGPRLIGLWHHAPSGAGVILCHGMEASKEGVKSVRLATALAARGVNALRFDFSYVGESEGEFVDLTVTGEVEDLAGAWAFAGTRAGGRLGIIGSSLGGTVGLLFAAAEPASRRWRPSQPPRSPAGARAHCQRRSARWGARGYDPRRPPRRRVRRSSG